MTRTRARADERNEKTTAVKADRLMKLLNSMPDMSVEDLEKITEDGSRSYLHEYAELLLQEKREKMDRKRLANLLERLVEFMGDHGRGLEYGEGKPWILVTDDDLLRAAELLDPDD